MNKTKATDKTNRQTANVSFDVVDKKGRLIGAKVYTFEIDFIEIESDSGSYWTIAPGHYFGFIPQATRNGQDYGAIQNFRLFLTPAERDDAIAKYLAAARKRAG